LLIPETKRKTLEDLTGEDHWITTGTAGDGDNHAESGSENEKAV